MLLDIIIYLILSSPIIVPKIVPNLGQEVGFLLK